MSPHVWTNLFRVRDASGINVERTGGMWVNVHVYMKEARTFYVALIIKNIKIATLTSDPL